VKKTFLLIFTLFYGFLAFSFGQNSNEASYASEQNPYYWKNRKPYPDYWQQDVHYNLKIDLDERLDIIDGSEVLTYTNNSPDELNIVYFHLYQNAFQPDSYLDNLTQKNKAKSNWGKYESLKLGTVISKLTQNGIALKSELDNTILKVYLNKALKSGESTQIELDFVTHFGDGATRRRMKKFISFGSKHYNGTHFYPRICVYDKKFGWDTHQHLNREFYGDFGTFEVELTCAANNIVEATGSLQNKAEVLPDSLLKKLDLKNFANKVWNSKPSVIIPYDENKRKTWKYSAVNVHDFAFTANPNYRIGQTTWNGIEIVAMVQEPHAAFWQSAAEYAAKIVACYSNDFGLYVYPKIVVADAADGMEYPMLTLVGGYEPNYHQLFAHEIGHNWFFGMVGNNETYRPALDEGFTQFLTAWAVEKVDGKYTIEIPARSSYVKNFSDPEKVRFLRVYKNYINDALKNETQQLNTHSDDFNGALGQGGGYKEVYYKTASMLYNLEYVLGDSLFNKAMQHYFHQWKIAHPYFEDFRNSIIDFTKVDLNWFFDQWLETTKTLDYKIKSVKSTKNENEYKVTFKRLENAQMPIDFLVTSKDKKSHAFHIPNTWFVKETSATVLPKWYGWGNKLNTSYTALINIPGGIKKIQIDTSYRLSDFNLLNNSTKTPIRFRFDHQIANEPIWEKYEMFWRPALWYNGYDGIKAGLHFNGNYFQQRHIFDATIFYNTGLVQQNFPHLQKDFDLFSFDLNYKTALRNIGKKFIFSSNAKLLDGLQNLKAGIEKTSFNEKTRFYFYFKSMLRRDSSDLNYLIYSDEWQITKQNNTLNFGLQHNYFYENGNGKIFLNLKSAAFTKDYSYSSVAFIVLNQTRLGKFDLSTRFYLHYLIGTSIPDESALYLAGSNPEDMMDSKYTRSVGLIPSSWQGYSETTNHFQSGGGLNLRGYAGYTPVVFTPNLNQRKLYKGNSGGAINAELSFIRLFKTRYSKIKKYLALDMYLFGDVGSIDFTNDSGKQVFAKVRSDAGLGTTLKIKKWGFLDKPSPLTLRFDMPFFLSNPPDEEPEFIKFRWVVGISRAF
jgi:uncharacterized protein affecting Mg2+/Co2+ transport